MSVCCYKRDSTFRVLGGGGGGGGSGASGRGEGGGGTGVGGTNVGLQFKRKISYFRLHPGMIAKRGVLKFVLPVLRGWDVGL